jgi:arylsulfatase A-like enzyme
MGWLLASAMAWSAEKPMNVVFFLVDDMGQRDIGAYGSTFYETPHLDRLAKEGARFSDAYAACPVCSPTRASILTGQWPQRMGVTDYIGAVKEPALWNRNTKLLPAPYADRLALGTPTMASLLKQAGYATCFAGKWHLGPEGNWPENFGFDKNFGGIAGGGPSGKNPHFSPYKNPRLSDGPPGEHLSDRLADETVRFIEANKAGPFFAYFSFYDVHTPLNARKDLVEKYQNKRKALGLTDKWGREETRDVRLSQDHAIYAAMVESVDLAVGKVLEKLDELNLRDNTLVIFTSDNGGLSTSEGWPTSNMPLRAGKGWMYEGGIREPLLVRWPGVSKPGTVIGNPVSSPDFLPTLLDVAKMKTPASVPQDGISLRDLLRKDNGAERSLFWHYPHYGNQGGAPSAAVRKGPWKLIFWYEEERVELFDLSKDLGETKNLATEQAQRAGQMLAELKQWQQKVGAKFPTQNPKYNPQKPDGRVADRKK